MLLPKDINPINTLYYNGAIALNVLENSEQHAFDFWDLYTKVKSAQEISLQSFILSLDWLYLLGSVKLNKNGKIEKCFKSPENRKWLNYYPRYSL